MTMAMPMDSTPRAHGSAPPLDSASSPAPASGSRYPAARNVVAPHMASRVRLSRPSTMPTPTPMSSPLVAIDVKTPPPPPPATVSRTVKTLNPSAATISINAGDGPLAGNAQSEAT